MIFLTINTVIRKHTVETTRRDFEMPYSPPPDEVAQHDAQTIADFSDAVRRGFPDARITWAFSWQALHDTSAHFQGLRETVRAMHARYGDDVTFVPGGYFANRYNDRAQINRDLSNALTTIEGFMGGYRPRALVAGFLAS